MRRCAALIKRPARARKALPALLFFTDPQRTPDVEAVAEELPAGSAMVLRTFGAVDAEAQARRLLAIARRRGLRLLIGQDEALAERVGAHGVHLPERLARTAAAVKARHPAWLVTAAAHSMAAAQSARGADAAVVSAVFPSRSPSAGAPIGPVRLALLVRQARVPVYALGGVNDRTAARLVSAGLAGFAAVEGLRSGRTTRAERAAGLRRG